MDITNDKINQIINAIIKNHNSTPSREDKEIIHEFYEDLQFTPPYNMYLNFLVMDRNNYDNINLELLPLNLKHLTLSDETLVEYLPESLEYLDIMMSENLKNLNSLIPQSLIFLIIDFHNLIELQTLPKNLRFLKIYFIRNREINCKNIINFLKLLGSYDEKLNIDPKTLYKTSWESLVIIFDRFQSNEYWKYIKSITIDDFNDDQENTYELNITEKNNLCLLTIQSKKQTEVFCNHQDNEINQFILSLLENK